MDDRRKMDVQLIRESVNRNEYQVDARAVAEAIVVRLLAGRAHGNGR